MTPVSDRFKLFDGEICAGRIGEVAGVKFDSRFRMLLSIEILSPAPRVLLVPDDMLFRQAGSSSNLGKQPPDLDIADGNNRFLDLLDHRLK